MSAARMTYFGEPRDAPVYEDIQQVDPPIGQPCLHCQEPIVEGDQGFMQWTVGIPGPARQPIHWECHMRMTIGSVGHIEGRCSCYGGTEDDPPGATRREAAQAAVEAFHRKYGVG